MIVSPHHCSTPLQLRHGKTQKLYIYKRLAQELYMCCQFKLQPKAPTAGKHKAECFASWVRSTVCCNAASQLACNNNLHPVWLPSIPCRALQEGIKPEGLLQMGGGGHRVEGEVGSSRKSKNRHTALYLVLQKISVG